MDQQKSELLEKARAHVAEKIERLHQVIDDLQDALKLETRCSAGDKYETGRAMLHLEFEKLSGQLEQYRKLRRTLASIPDSSSQEKIGFGSMVKTTVANYFLAIPAGELKTGVDSFYAVGINSPVATALIGKRSGDSFHLNGRKYLILSVC